MKSVAIESRSRITSRIRGSVSPYIIDERPAAFDRHHQTPFQLFEMMRNKRLGKTEFLDNSRDRFFLAAHAKQDPKAIFIRKAFR